MSSIRFANIEPDFAPALAEVERLAFPNLTDRERLSVDDLIAFWETFPEGGFVALDGSRPVGMGLGIFLDFDFEHPERSMGEVTGSNQCANHDPDGAWYYGTDISVHPDSRRRGIGRELYALRKQLVRDHRRRGIVAGGVIPGFAEHIDSMEVDEYVAAVKGGELYDPTLSFQIDNGFEPVEPLPDYLDDESVGNWAVLIVWSNPEQAS